MTSTPQGIDPTPPPGARATALDWIEGLLLLAAAVYLFWVYAVGQWAHTFYFLDSW